MLVGWLPADGSETLPVISSMAAALRVSDGEQVRLWPDATLGIGVMELPFGDDHESMEPARGHDGSMLWMSGEAFDWPSHGGLGTAAESRTPAFRSRVLEALLARGPEAIRDLDGEYQIAVWRPQMRTLQLLNDRFGALPMYIASSRQGTAFGGGVRGVVVGPGISCEPDTQAIREAVSFGGYRLGSRTNVRDVRMVPPASVVTISPTGVTTKRYWTWSELRLKPEPTELKLREGDAADEQEFLEEARSSWRAAITRRLDGARRPGLTLSGGLDSRAILAEASRQQPHMRTLTYGVPQSDDVTIARRAARAANAEWELFPLYADGWLERRSRRILETDGLMDLVDLMHTEPLDALPSTFDVYLSGFIGDVVAGSTWFFEKTPEDLLTKLPYYGGSLAIPYDDALRVAEEIIGCTEGPPRFALYEHKGPQSINRITAAARPFVTVRRPFVDYRFFELCQRLPPAWREGHRWRERWLVSTYPGCFARIPNQSTGVPPQSSRLRWQVTRTARFVWRRTLGAAQSAGLRVSVPERSYHPDERYWSQPAERAELERTILRNESISCDVFGRARVAETLRDFFERRASPVQVIGALYVFERYHQTLAASLAAARRTAREFLSAEASAKADAC